MSKLGWLRLAGGLAGTVLGGVWFFQGIGWLKGSFMTGDSTWTVIGLVLLVPGLALLTWHRIDSARRHNGL